MTKGVLVIAIGKPLYGRLAVTLAASIRNKSDVPVALITDDKALEEIPQHQKDIFTLIIPAQVDKSLTYNEQAFKIKTELYHYSPFDVTLHLDADNIILPGRSVDEWFNKLKGIEFTSYCNGVYDYATRKYSRSDYTYWADPEIVRAYFKFKGTKMPQINSSFLYFEKSEKVRLLFQKAQEVWKSDFECGKYRNAKPDEFCFNTALAMMDMLPHQIPYRPLFFEFQSENADRSYVNDNFIGLSVITDQKADIRVENMYNEWMTYYFTKFGWREKYYYTQKTKKEHQKIIGFWHICTINNWKEVVNEQLHLLKYDGLLNKCDQIIVAVVGDHEEAAKLINHPKIKIKYHSPYKEEYEFPCMNLIKQFAENNQFYGFYFHTKGVSSPNNPIKKLWRNLLNHYNLTLWERLYSKLVAGYDIAGANWFEPRNAWEAHFSGNFWWFDSEYIKRLPDVNKLDWKSRHQAEFWITRGTPKYYCIATHRIDDYGRAEWFPEKKLGVFISDISMMESFRASDLSAEFHYAIAKTDGEHKKHLYSGMLAVTEKDLDTFIQAYCLQHPDAYVLVEATEESIARWKECYEILGKGYDSVAGWIRAEVVNKGKIMRTYQLQ